MKKLFCLIFLAAASSASVFAQSNNKAIFLIQTFDIANKQVASGTGFFIDAQGNGITQRDLFINAASAKIITLDSTVHNIVKLMQEDPETGLVKFSVDNNLTTKFEFLKVGQIETSADMITARDIQKNESVKISIEKKDIEGYGSVFISSTSISTSFL